MKTLNAALLAAGVCVALGLQINGRQGGLKDYAEEALLFGLAGAIGGAVAATGVRQQTRGASRVIGAGVLCAITSGAFALVAGSAYFVLANPNDGLAVLGGIFAGVESGVAGAVTGGLIGALP